MALILEKFNIGIEKVLSYSVEQINLLPIPFSFAGQIKNKTQKNIPIPQELLN